MRAFSLLLIAILTTLFLTVSASASDPFTVSGNVTDAEGTAMAYADVMLLDADGWPCSTTRADANGSYIFVDVCKDTPQISVTASFVKPTIKGQRWGKHSSLHNATGHVIIPDNETRFSDYIIPKTGIIHGFIVRESDQILLNGTVYLSNGNTSVVTNPRNEYRLEAPPGNYTVYAMHYGDGITYMSDKMDIEILPASNIYESQAVDMLMKPVGTMDRDPNWKALVLALALGLAGLLVLRYVLRK